MTAALSSALRALRAMLSLMVLMPVAACFGTGVAPASADADIGSSKSSLSALIVADSTLTPPAPALGEVRWVNSGAAPITIGHIGVDDAAKTTVTATECEGFPTLGANVSCRVQLAAGPDAIPGSYPVVVAYSQNGAAGEATFQLNIEPGTLRINDGAPLALDAYSTVTPITVTNEGFNLSQLNLQAQCPHAASQTSTCRLDPNSCSTGLAANQSCTAYLTVVDGAGGQAGAVTAGGANTGAVGCATPISVAQLTVGNMAVATPGTHTLTLSNGGLVPLSLLDVSITAAQAVGVSPLSVSRVCQGFLGSCTVSVAVGPEAVLTDGLGVITVHYTDGLATHVARGVLVLNTLTTVQVQPITHPLQTGVTDTVVSALNVGPWVWHRAGLSLAPPLPGATVHSTCSTDIAVGDSYTATLSANAPAEAFTSALVAQGSNLASPQNTPVTSGRSIVLVGQDAQGHGSAIFSTDGGTTYTTADSIQGVDVLNRVLLTDSAWVAVGSLQGNPAIVQSYDRGVTWQRGSLQISGPAELHAVATDGNLWVAFGGDSNGAPICFKNTQQNLNWTLGGCNLDGLAIGTIKDAAYNGTAWTVVGSLSSNYFLIVSPNNMATWNAPIAGPGAATGITWAQNTWIAVGTLTNGNNPQKALVAHNSSPSAPDASWIFDDTTLLGNGGLGGIASNQLTWVAYGDDGASQAIAVSGTFAGATALTVVSRGRGELIGGALHNGEMLVLYVDTNSYQTELDVSTDGQNFSLVRPLSNGVASSVASR